MCNVDDKTPMVDVALFPIRCLHFGVLIFVWRNWVYVLHLFRGGRLDPYGLDPVWTPMASRPTGPVSCTLSAVTAWTPMAWTCMDPYDFPPDRACVPRFVCGGCLDPCGLDPYGPLWPSAPLGLCPTLLPQRLWRPSADVNRHSSRP